MSHAAIVAALTGQGVPRDAAHRAATSHRAVDDAPRPDTPRETRHTPRETAQRASGHPSPVDDDTRRLRATQGHDTVALGTRRHDDAHDALTLTLPWHEVVSDNLHVAPLGRVARRHAMTYQHARNAAAASFTRQRAMTAHAAHPPLTVPCALLVVAFMPNARWRDVGNLRKCATDAMQQAGVVVNDAQFVAEAWVNGGIDRVNPRLDFLVQPLGLAALTIDRRGLAAVDVLRAAILSLPC